jgi:AraC family transcriptional regulator
MDVATRETAHDGREVTRAAVGSLEVFHLRFPPSYRHGVVDPSRGYLAVVLEGAVCKSFRRSSSILGRGSFMSIPAGAAHSSDFAAGGCHVLVVRPADGEEEHAFGSILRNRAQVAAEAPILLAWQIAKELECGDAYSRLALEGLMLELLACAGRAGMPTSDRDVTWLRTVRDVLHDSTPHTVSLRELGDVVGRHPAHVARAFRRAYGVSVAAYARSLRLEWATVALATTDDSLTHIALEAGFADQSHFTRSFRRHHGVTPGRYRQLVRA